MLVIVLKWKPSTLLKGSSVSLPVKEGLNIFWSILQTLLFIDWQSYWSHTMISLIHVLIISSDTCPHEWYQWYMSTSYPVTSPSSSSEWVALHKGSHWEEFGYFGLHCSVVWWSQDGYHLYCQLQLTIPSHQSLPRGLLSDRLLHFHNCYLGKIKIRK